jgi:hypothetical protein
VQCDLQPSRCGTGKHPVPLFHQDGTANGTPLPFEKSPSVPSFHAYAGKKTVIKNLNMGGLLMEQWNNILLSNGEAVPLLFHQSGTMEQAGH